MSAKIWEPVTLAFQKKKHLQLHWKISHYLQFCLTSLEPLAKRNHSESPTAYGSLTFVSQQDKIAQKLWIDHTLELPWFPFGKGALPAMYGLPYWHLLGVWMGRYTFSAGDLVKYPKLSSYQLQCSNFDCAITHKSCWLGNLGELICE